MKEKKKSAAGRLFYTFGTVLLISVLAVCTINFVRDGRVFEAPLLSAVSGTPSAQSSTGAAGSDDYKTIKYNKSKAKSSSGSTSSRKSSSKGSKSTEKPSAAPTPAPSATVDP